jgi:hypothetical protein
MVDYGAVCRDTQIVSSLYILGKLQGKNFATSLTNLEPQFSAILKSFGHPLDCDNYRTLSLIAHIGKLTESLIYNRLYPITEKLGCDFLVEASS